MAERQAAVQRTTFGECADDLIARMESGWRNRMHAGQWKMTLTEYAKPLRALPVEDVTTEHRQWGVTANHFQPISDAESPGSH